MKKRMALVLTLVCFFALAGCNNRSMNYIINNEPNITGIVKNTFNNSILIENENGEYSISLNVENKDSMTHFSIGDEVVVYYDGTVLDSSPMQIKTVYAITLKTPADTSENGITDENEQGELEIREGYAMQTVQFACQTTDDNSEMISLNIALPTDWEIVYDYKTYEVIPFKEYTDLMVGDDCVGGIGFLQYDIPDDQEIPVDGIFNQITMGAMTVWNIKQHFELVTDDDLDYKTALTSVLYAGRIFTDGKERTNSGIVSYHPETKMYIALELTDGSKDREILTAEEIRYVAESIEWLYDEDNENENKAKESKPFTSDDAVELLKEQLIIAYENAYGEFVPSDKEPSTFTGDKERLSYIISRLTVKEETDQYYIIPVIWDFYVDKETQEIFKFYNGIDEMFIPFDPQADTALAFAG